MTVEEYRNNMMKLAEKDLPKESKSFLKTEAQKLKRPMPSYAKSNVPVSRIPESDTHKKYHKSFKTGKTYKYNESYAKRVYSAAKHGKYVESGRPVVYGYKRGEAWGRNSYNPKTGRGRKSKRGEVKDKLYAVDYRSKHYEVVWHVKQNFDPIYYADVDAWINKMLKEGKL